jgi:hypothetical protein
MSEEERRTLGASEFGHGVLKRLEADGIFPEMMDAYRFAIALGLSKGRRTPFTGRRTVFNVGSFDKDEAVSGVISALMEVEAAQVYRVAEELAETGFQMIAPVVDAGEFRFDDFLTSV